MSPYRLHGPAAMLMQIDSTGVATGGVVALIGWVIGDGNATLLVVAFAVMIADITSGVLRALALPPGPGEKFSGKRLRRGAVLKMLELHVVVLGAVLDWTVKLSVPETTGFIEHWMPWTRLAMLVLIATEVSSLRNNIKAVVALPDAFDRVIKSLGKGDAGAVLEATHAIDEVRAPAGEPLDRRWTDRLPAAPPASGATSPPDGEIAP